MSDASTTAATVRAEMARRRVPQIKLAQHLGLSQTAISRRMSGETDFTVTELQAVAALLDVPAGDLLGAASAA